MPTLHCTFARLASGGLVITGCLVLAAGPRAAAPPDGPAGPLVRVRAADRPAQARPEPAPPHVRQDWKQRIGTWIAENDKYQSEAEPFDAFGIEWRWGLNQQGLVGRLYGIRDGNEVGTFWEFREFWHPSDRTVVAMQFGRSGEYGVGPAQRNPDGSYELLQTFYDPEQGTVTRIGHRGQQEGDVNTSTSFYVGEKGEWKPRRTYVWRRR